MILEIETFTVEINQFRTWNDDDTELVTVFGYKAEPNYHSQGFPTLSEMFKALDKEINLLVEDFGSLCCFPNYQVSIPGQFVDWEF